MVGEKIDGVGNSFGGGFGHIRAVTAIVVGGAIEIPAVNTISCPGATSGGGFMDENASAWRGERGYIEVKGTVELSFGRQAWVEA
jgi:hypothetical protein